MGEEQLALLFTAIVKPPLPLLNPPLELATIQPIFAMVRKSMYTVDWGAWYLKQENNSDIIT